MLQKRRPHDPAENFKDVRNRRKAEPGEIPDQLRFGVFLVVFVFISAIRGLEEGILPDIWAKGKLGMVAVEFDRPQSLA
jgi:hypothetical protein